MKTYCHHYIPNNSDFSLAGCCTLRSNKPNTYKKCPFAGKFPEMGIEPTATNQEDCKNYKEWQDPLVT